MEKKHQSRFKKDNTVKKSTVTHRTRYTLDNRPGVSSSGTGKPVSLSPFIHPGLGVPSSTPWMMSQLSQRHYLQRRRYAVSTAKFSPRRKPVFRRHPGISKVTSTLHLKTIVKGGIRYRASRNKLTRAQVPLVSRNDENDTTRKSTSHIRKSTVVNIKGTKFAVHPSGRSLKRIQSVSPSTSLEGTSPKQVELRSVGSSKFVDNQKGIFVQNSTDCDRINRVRKSINNIYKYERKKKCLQKMDCLFYCRFGKCLRQTSCPYVHDPEKIAVCTRFLRGTCRDPSHCPFSHKTHPDKIPTCLQYLRGVCCRDLCPYRHVNPGLNAEVCRVFVKFGHCDAEDCPYHHVMICPDFAKNSTCSKKKCSLKHSQILESARKPGRSLKVQNNNGDQPLAETKDFIPILLTLEPEPETSSYQEQVDDAAEGTSQVNL